MVLETCIFNIFLCGCETRTIIKDMEILAFERKYSIRVLEQQTEKNGRKLKIHAEHFKTDDNKNINCLIAKT